MGREDERAGGRKALLVVILVWLAFVLPFFRGQVRFPVDFAGPRDGQQVTRLANPEQGDAYLAMYPWHRYLGERLSRGELPLWDPHRFAGTPFAADIAMGVWYPPNWLYALGHTLHVLTFISVASSLAAVLLMFWFLRLLRLHPYAAALGAVAFAFSAFVVKWATNDTVLGSVVWLALPLGGLEVARQGRRWRGTLLTTVGLALVVLGGHAQLALFVWAVTAIWATIGLASTAAQLFRTGSARIGAVARGLTHGAVPALAAVALALGLTAIQLLPTRQLTEGIVRQRTTWDLAQATFLPPQHGATFLLADYLGSPIDGNYDGPGVNYTETMLYAGLLTLPLALYGVRHRHRRAALFFATLTVVGLLSIFGTPFYRVVLAAPGLSRGLFATRFILLVDFGLAGLAALGLDRLLRRDRQHRGGLMLLGGSFVALASAVAWLTLVRPGTSLPGSYLRPLGGRGLAILVLGGAAVAVMVRLPSWAARMAVVIVVVSAADLWATGYRFNPFTDARPVYPVKPPIGELQAVPGPRPRYADIGSSSLVPPNGALVYGLYGLAGYDPLIPVPIVELVGIAEDQLARARSNFFGPFRAGTARSPVFDLLGIENVVGRLDLLSGPGGPGTPLLRRPDAFPPAFVAGCWDVVPPGRVLDRLARMTSAELRGTVVVGDVPAARSALGPGATGGTEAGCAAGEARVARYEPERVTMDVEADRPSVVVLSDAWFPGWEATVDGDRAPLLRVDHALRGVAVGPGTHRVEMRFRSAPFRYGATITLMTLALLAGAALAPVVRRRRATARGAADRADRRA